jgi:hypothetical protein
MGETMAAKTINLAFKGYRREVNIGGLPKISGIYTVYVDTYNSSLDTVTLHKLIYIGQAEDINDRIANHEKWAEWRKYVGKGQELCFGYAEIANPDRERAECALIFHHKPPCCEQCTSSFDYDETTVISTGRHEFIDSPITVKRTPSN